MNSSGFTFFIHDAGVALAHWVLLFVFFFCFLTIKRVVTAEQTLLIFVAVDYCLSLSNE